MKKLLLIIVLFSYTYLTQAQEKKSIDLYLKSGISLPFGTYTQNNAQKYGFATKGFTTGLGATYWLSPKIGAFAEFNYSLHPLDAFHLGEALSENNLSATKVNTKTNAYQQFATTLGILYCFKISNKFAISPKLQAGLLHTTTPELHNVLQTSPITDITIKSGKVLSFVYGAGFVFNYTLSNKFVLGISTDYYGSNANIAMLESGISSTISQKIDYVNVGLQLNYRIR
jgi:hypothetical protein